MPFSPEDFAAAQQLRLAAALIERHAPTDDVRQLRDRVNTLRLIGLMVAALERPMNREICRRCQALFTFDARWFLERGLVTPRHCGVCREQRRLERRAAGMGGVPTLTRYPGDE
jgi:hypothetical protein